MQQCVESVSRLALAEDEREIIVVDDGSLDDIREQLSAICGGIVYIRQENGGLSVARNTGIETARGTYIQFVDGDDRLIPDVYDRCISKLKDAKPDLLMFRLTRSEDGSGNKAIADSSPGVMTGAEYMSTNNLRSSACGYVFKKNMLGDLRFFPHTYHEDDEFTPQLVVRAESLIEVECKPYFYRIRQQSITTKRNVEHIEKRLNDVQRIILKLHDIAAQLDGEKKDGMKRRVAQLTVDYILLSIMHERSGEMLTERIGRLKEHSLYPLPCDDYNIRYTLFRMLANNGLGLKLLQFVVKLIKGAA